MKTEADTQTLKKPSLIIKIKGRSLFVIYDDGTKEDEDCMCSFEGVLGFEALKPKSSYTHDDFHGNNEYLFKKNFKTTKAVLIKMLNNNVQEQHTNVNKVLKKSGSKKNAVESLVGIVMRKLAIDLDNGGLDKFVHKFPMKEVKEKIENTDGRSIPFIEKCKRLSNSYSGSENFLSSVYT